ncbi:MAG: hypothetical protein ACLTYN_16670 [Dysosmobacter welbionis]
MEVHISDVDSREPFRQVSYAVWPASKPIKVWGSGLCDREILKDYLSK